MDVRHIKRFFATKEAPIALILVLVSALIGLRSGKFFSFENFMDIIKSNTVLGICSLGMLLVIITGGIDVSISGIVATVTVVTGELMVRTGFSNVPLIFLCGILLGGLIGSLNGLMVSKLKLPPIIATLGTNAVLMGLVRFYTNGTWINNIPEPLTRFGATMLFGRANEYGAALGMPVQLPLLLLALIVTWLLLRHTMLGRSIMAMGGSPVAAERIGLNTTSLTTFAYAFSGMMGGFAAIVHTSIMKSVDPNAFAYGFELNVIGAVVLGGASLAGGMGSTSGTLLGVLLFSVINNGLTLTEIPTFWQKIVVGFILLAAVSFDVIKLKREEQRQTKVDIETLSAEGGRPHG